MRAKEVLRNQVVRTLPVAVVLHFSDSLEQASFLLRPVSPHWAQDTFPTGVSAAVLSFSTDDHTVIFFLMYMYM